MSQASTTPTPSPPQASEALTADLPGFKVPKTMPTDELDPNRTRLSDPPGPETPPAGSWERDAISDLNEAPDDDRLEPSQPSSSATTSSRGFTSPEVFEAPIAGLVQIASLGVHTARRAPGALWLADQEDVENITAPLARIAARHSPVEPGKASDLADGIEAALGVANYAVKNIRAEAETAVPPAQRPDEPTPYQPPQ